jgi:Uma2 family endonuclease
MQHVMSRAALVTAEELETFAADDYRYELVQGRVIRASPASLPHGQIAVQFGALLLQHVKPRKLGVVGAEVGFILARNPDTVRGPDVAFIRQDRLPSGKRKGFWEGAPDLAVEIVSPDNTRSEIRTKVREYLGRGAGAVVVIDPKPKAITVHCPKTPPTRLATKDDVLDLSDVIADFRCTLADIFD